MRTKTRKNNDIGHKKSKKINLINLIETRNEKNILEFNNSYRPTFSIDPETNMSNTKMLIEVMLANNWIMKKFSHNIKTDWCNNSNNSKIKNKDFLRYNHWANKFQLFIILKNEEFIPNTYPIYQGKWTMSEPENDSLFFIKTSNGSRGKNITIVNKKSDVVEISKNRNKLLVIQEGIDCLLYENKKFDIRIWGSLISSDFIDFKLIFYNFGKVRLSTKNYESNTLNLDNHLTNTYLHKNNDNYKEVFFDEDFPDYSNKFEKIKDIIQKTFEKSKDLFVNLKNHNQKLIWNLGFDFIFDNDGKCYLLEINGFDVAAYNNKYIDDWYLFLVSNVYKNFASGTEPYLENKNITVIG